MITIELGDREYKVREANDNISRAKGLSGITKLPEDEGMIFYFDKPQKVSFWMKDTKIPLDIIFIGEDEEVISVKQGKPMDETPITEDNVLYVVEVNVNSGIQPGDELDFEDDKMLVLAPDGGIQMKLEGGERIFSRKSTKVLIKKAKKAKSVQKDKAKFIQACKSLGKYIFKELSAQDNRDPEYVEIKDKK